VSGLLERLQSPPSRALRDAGPPNGHVFFAVVASVALLVIVWGDREVGMATWVLMGAIAFLQTGVVSVIDGDGWAIRDALAWIAREQRARMGSLGLVDDREGLQAWVDDPANLDADPLLKASALTGLDRWDEANALLDSYATDDPVKLASRIRIQSMIKARSTGRIDPAPLRAAVQQLSAAEAKYQLASTAWSQAWLDLTAHRPWRKEFAKTARELRPFALSLKIRIFIAIEQLLAPIICLVGIALAIALHAFGLAA
jgi:hypothetical protein